MPSSNGTRSHIRACARERLGYDQLRPGQEEAILPLLEGRDVLAVLPTGTGKSAIYKIAGALLEGPTIVVSPLIALQKDQVAAIEGEDVGDAAQLNSTVRSSEKEEALDRAGNGGVEFLLMAPEQFRKPETLQRLRDAKPSLFVVDEAHCVSEWGHDFRPDYLQLAKVAEELGRPPVLALTASAAPPVREEIIDRLGMSAPQSVVTGFDRPNIWLGAKHFYDEQAKRSALMERVAASPRPGIVYVSTHRHAEDVASALQEMGIDAAAYHAGLKVRERCDIQDAFMAGGLEVIVATSAFGMGIDKPDVRFVFHYDAPESVDAYYQQIGRAGRDGQDAAALLFYRKQDMALHRFQASSGKVGRKEIETVARALSAVDEPVSPGELTEQTDLSAAKLNNAIHRLEDVGAVQTVHTGEAELADPNLDLAAAAKEAAREEEARRQHREWRIRQMEVFAEEKGCRRQALLSYFGEALPEPCGNCDNCQTAPALPQDVGGPFPVNGTVRHPKWGVGRVLRYEDERIVVDFDSEGEKALDLNIVSERGLLQSDDPSE